MSIKIIKEQVLKTGYYIVTVRDEWPEPTIALLDRSTNFEKHAVDIDSVEEMPLVFLLIGDDKEYMAGDSRIEILSTELDLNVVKNLYPTE